MKSESFQIFQLSNLSRQRSSQRGMSECNEAKISAVIEFQRDIASQFIGDKRKGFCRSIHKITEEDSSVGENENESTIVKSGGVCSYILTKWYKSDFRGQSPCDIVLGHHEGRKLAHLSNFSRNRSLDAVVGQFQDDKV